MERRRSRQDVQTTRHVVCQRAFRIGQQRNVLVHKFVCRGTVEERIDEMISDKRQLASQILDGEGAVKLTEMKDDELLKFVSLDLERAAVV